MSIIYDALKKAENPTLRPQINNQVKLKTKKKRSFYFIYLFALIAVVFSAKFILGFFSNNASRQPPIQAKPAGGLPISGPPAPVRSRKAEPKKIEKKKLLISTPRLSLNGILYDQRLSYAIINDQVLKEGDSIEGARIMRILPESVEFEINGEKVSLKPGK